MDLLIILTVLQLWREDIITYVPNFLSIKLKWKNKFLKADILLTVK
jgi:hypothetical protein